MTRWSARVREDNATIHVVHSGSTREVYVAGDSGHVTRLPETSPATDQIAAAVQQHGSRA